MKQERATPATQVYDAVLYATAVIIVCLPNMVAIVLGVSTLNKLAQCPPPLLPPPVPPPRATVDLDLAGVCQPLYDAKGKLTWRCDKENLTDTLCRQMGMGCLRFTTFNLKPQQLLGGGAVWVSTAEGLVEVDGDDAKLKTHG